MAVAVAATDWALKLSAAAAGYQLSLHERHHPWLLIPLSAVLVGAVIAAATSRVLIIGSGMLLGGGLGNLGELLVLGHVTDFIPLGSGWLASPADLCLFAGFAVIAAGHATRVLETVTRAARAR